MLNRRWGRFEVTWEILTRLPKVVKRIMGECLIVEASYRKPCEIIKYIAISDHFDIVEIGDKIPLYYIRIITDTETRKTKFMFYRESDFPVHP